MINPNLELELSTATTTLVAEPDTIINSCTAPSEEVAEFIEDTEFGVADAPIEAVATAAVAPPAPSTPLSLTEAAARIGYSPAMLRRISKGPYREDDLDRLQRECRKIWNQDFDRACALDFRRRYGAACRCRACARWGTVHIGGVTTQN